jgi:adenylate kinase family enzyme
LKHFANETTYHYEKYLDVREEFIVGRTDEKNKIMILLEEVMKDYKIVILPIYGIGGTGKTTFAKMISSDRKFISYSQVWVNVSQRFDLAKIHNAITSQLSDGESRALIVLDDLWEECPVKLEELSTLLYRDHRSTIVLVTTRNKVVADKICTNFTKPHKIEFLKEDMCWKIIEQRSAFKARGDKEYLLDIGKEIAKKCRGMALAAQSLGFSLKTLGYNEWKKVNDSDIWSKYDSRDAYVPNYILPSLKLSYEYMAPPLKLCFAYCGIFPKGHNIVKDELIYQWISLDLTSVTNMLSIMQACENHIVQLVGLSFLQPALLPLVSYSCILLHMRSYQHFLT